mmetsp:Transcript_23164/g.33959  ORF Transcript_23164/g.33959 Transcript_23164/m.33959 type:complete len:1078 (-) Transcript_23164:146-3379(-)|eukprot:CAMPEP_0185036054 /NCGR_PEP_ID=MMETSP1103-20130426/28464_1 /TAXON_ID=36769 /ORGANISM="Paraphysomonas bandaiensis, Strain Caron Lab Isolate" /LENGTH=1077 /DNA_ID=CAMNT_0027573427 /DNA_START=145 /DNA_END=3378 /DNA_ORIENTATION=+
MPNKSSNLLEQARRQAKGQRTDRNDWNEVTVGNKTFTMEYPLVDGGLGSRVNIEDISYTYAYDRTQNKVQCELCTMWFDKKSVFYKVPNHRILKLRKSWNYIQTGARYSSASYLYRNSCVCSFCTQFFSKASSPSVDTDKIEFAPQITKHETKLPLYTTTISRKNIAVGCRAYQSNEVDSQGPHLALEPPYINSSKTRREADPWWEVDLGKTIHVHSVSMSLKGALQQKVEVLVLLLKGPVGFEDPFIDSIVSTAVASHRLFLENCSKTRMENLYWELPPDSKGGAIRVQIRGFHTLCLSKFQAFQGDILLTDSQPVQLSDSDSLPYPDDVTNLDEQIRYDSTAAYPPHTFKKCKAIKDRKTASSTASVRPRAKTEKLLQRVGESVGQLHNKFNNWNSHVKDWVSRALEASKHFTLEELVAMRDMIFNSAVASTTSNSSSSPPRSPAALMRRSVGRPNSPESRGLGHVVRAQDMYGAALMETHPRCDIDNLVKAVKAAGMLTQGRDQGGGIGLLQASPRFMFLSTDAYETISSFQLVCQFVKDHCKPPKSISVDSSTSLASTTTEHVVECSWSQFVIVMWLLSIGRPEEIPLLAFNIFEDLDVLRDQICTYSVPTLSRAPSQNYDPSQPSSRPSSPNGGEYYGARRLSRLGSRVDSTDLDDDSNFFATSEHHGDSVETARDRPVTPQQMRTAPARPPRTADLSGISPVHTPTTSRRRNALGRSRSKKQILWTAPASIGEPGFEQSSSQEQLGTSTASCRERAKNQPLTLAEKFKDEAVAKLNLNFGHSQYKLDRISLRVDVDVLPRHLRTRLSDVSFDETPVSTLNLGLADQKELFEVKGNLSPLGIAPTPKPVLPLERMSMSAVELAKKFNKKSPNNADRNRPKTSALDYDKLFDGSGSFLKSLQEDTTSSVSSQEIIDISTSESYKKNCSLCLHRFPATSLTNKVILKHIVTLRRGWDEKLVTKFNGDLALGMSLFNLVPVCVFCSQFFDPAFEDGVTPPSKSTVEAHVKKKKQDVMSKKQRALTEFYDQRYSGMKGAGDLLHAPTTLETRARARRALEIEAELKQQKLQDRRSV